MIPSSHEQGDQDGSPTAADQVIASPRDFGSRVRSVLLAGVLFGVAVVVPVFVGWSAGPAMAEPTPSMSATVKTTASVKPTDPATIKPSGPPSITRTAPEPSVSVTATPSVVRTPTPTTSSPSPSATTSTPAVTGTMPAVPPAYTQADGSPVSWVIAAVVLLVGVLTAVILARRARSRHPRRPAATTIASSPTTLHLDDSAVNLTALEAAGQAMTDAGYSVTAVRQSLEEIATVNGFPDTEVVVFPTALFVSTRGWGEMRTGAVTSGGSKLTLMQADALDDVITDARSTPIPAAELATRIAQVRALPAPFSKTQRVLAYAAASAGIAVLLSASVSGLVVASVLGLVVGVVLIRTEHVPARYQALVTVGCSFVVGVVVLALVTVGLDPGVLPSLIAPVVVFLPGALLTTGVVELFTGNMVAGAGRLAAGAMQLILLAAGVVAAAALVGLPSLDLTGAAQPIGPVGPWLAVAVFGVGIVIHSNGRPRSIGWILLVLYVAYGAQVLADIFVGGVLAAFVGAFAMTPVAALVARHPSGPAAFVSFLPAFWLLVPGALGLVGVTTILDGGSAGQDALVTTASTMVAIALGILAGSALADRVAPTRRALI